MSNLAEELLPTGAEQNCGIVSRVVDEAVIVELGDGTVWRARRAASCLLTPAGGDRVLVALVAGEGAYVTAVLERNDHEAARLELPGDAEIRAGSGRLGIFARDGVDIRSPRDVNVTASSVNVTAAAAQLAVATLGLVGGVLRSSWDRVTARARSAEESVDLLVQRLGSRVSSVEGLDSQQARLLRQDVSEVHTLNTRYSVMRATKDMKIDAEQIIMG